MPASHICHLKDYCHRNHSLEEDLAVTSPRQPCLQHITIEALRTKSSRFEVLSLVELVIINTLSKRHAPVIPIWLIEPIKYCSSF